jgi:hypothetical protein
MVPLLVLAALAGMAFLVVHVSRPHTMVVFEGGAARFVRGELPRGLRHDLQDVAGDLGSPGRLTLAGRGETLVVKVSGLDEGPAQRVRNVVMLHRSDIGRR